MSLGFVPHRQTYVNQWIATICRWWKKNKCVQRKTCIHRHSRNNKATNECFIVEYDGHYTFALEFGCQHLSHYKFFVIISLCWKLSVRHSVAATLLCLLIILFWWMSDCCDLFIRLFGWFLGSIYCMNEANYRNIFVSMFTEGHSIYEHSHPHSHVMHTWDL